MTTTLRLPLRHAQDWLARCGEDLGAEEVAQTARTVTLTLPPAALADIVSDARYYAEEMGPDNTGDFDYRPAARRCLASIERQTTEEAT